MKVVLDEGYMYGLGVFETISVYENHPVLLDYHMERLEKAIAYLKLKKKWRREKIQEYIQKNPMENGVLKVMVSEKNQIMTHRENPYTREQYEKGFLLKYSQIRRNESSPFTYLKSFHYGDNLLEKRRALLEGVDEPIFLNSRGEICEGACTNIFFVSGNEIITPTLSCGLLDGIMRRYILERYLVEERVVLEKDVEQFDEVFVTNSAIGIMPVYQLGEKRFHKRGWTQKIGRVYLEQRGEI